MNRKEHSVEYRLPTLQDKVMLRNYLDECWKNGEHNVMLAQDLLVEDYSAWLELIHANATEGNAEWGRSLFLLCEDGGEAIGILCVRHELSKELAAVYGNIGYAVLPSKRNRGYATQMLQHALDMCRDSGLESVTLGCYQDNLASIEVILKCGGALIAENDNYTEGRMSQYYAIQLA